MAQREDDPQSQAEPRVRIEEIAFPQEARAFSPRDNSPEAEDYFRQCRRRFPGRGSGSWSTGR